MGAALAMAARGQGRTAPNPSVGCVIVRGGRVVGRGWTQLGGRPHAEAMALAEAGEQTAGATAYVTLEPCARPGRGPDCAGLLIAAGVARVVAAIGDPFPSVDGHGFARLRAAGIAVTIGAGAAEATRLIGGFLRRIEAGRPAVTLKLATSLDGAIALADGRSRWITGDASRAHAHLERARHDAILVGRGTYDADAPRLDVRLAGLEDRAPRRLLLTRGAAPAGWETVAEPAAITSLSGVNDVLVEGGAQTASAFLRAGLVDRLLLYRAPILVGGGRPALADIGLGSLEAAHGRWRLLDSRLLGSDRMERYEAAGAA